MGKARTHGSSEPSVPATLAAEAAAAGTAPSAGRDTLLIALERLFLEGSSTLDERERALMIEVLHSLVDSVEESLSREIAERLARRTDAPRGVVTELIRGNIEAARPLLLHSPVLDDADLADAIDHGTVAHCLAIARRRGLSETVSGALVATGNRDIAITLLNNRSARISRETMVLLAERSRRVRALRAPLIRRPDLPADVARAMYWWVSAAQRSRIVSRFGVSPVVSGTSGARIAEARPSCDDEPSGQVVGDTKRPARRAPAEESSV